MNIGGNELKVRTVDGLTEFTNLIGEAPTPEHVTHEVAFAELKSMNRSDLQSEYNELFGKGSRSIYSIKLNGDADAADVWEALKLVKAGKLDGRCYSRVDQN